jgi:autotransporter-associated beta strand protein
VDLVIAGPSTTNAATIGTTGAVVLGATNTYDGQTFINGSVLSFSAANQLGTNATATAIVMNGGTLRYTGTGFTSLGAKGIQFDGNGGTLDVANGGAELYLDTAIISNATYRGDLIKVGAGTLTLNGTSAAFGSAGNPGFLGLMDIRQGTLRLAIDHDNNTAGNGSTEFSTAMGTSLSYLDGTIFRSGTNFAIQNGNANDAGEYSIPEWLTFEGNNYVSVGTINTVTGNTADAPGPTELSVPVPNPNNERPVNLSGVITINGATTFDVVPGQTLRVSNGSIGYITGAGDIIKDGQGTMLLYANNHDFTGNIVIKQGRLYGIGQAEVFGTGYTVANGSKTITLGSADRQGIAELAQGSDNIHGHTMELNHNLNVVYNPAQSKRLLLETFANGSQIELNGNITLNDNLQVYINDAAENGGSQNYVNLNGQLLDGATTSGNLVFTGDDTSGANDNTSGRPYNYLVLKNNNSGWTGDVRVNTNTGYDQDQTAILRLEHTSALTAANDVDMGFNSILQTGGGARTIGSLSTNGGVGPFIGGVAGGTMGASTNGTTVIIENAATTAGTLTITQSTPVSTEVQWNAHFRDGTLNSQFLAPGSGPTASAALNIVKAGDGWATLTTDNAHTGTTTVTGGILQVGRGGVGDTGNASTNGGLTANAGTTIAGTGQIHGSSTILGNLKPGDEAGGSMGTLVFTGVTNLGAASVSTLQIQRASYTAMNALGYDDAGYSTWIGGLTTDTTYSHLLNDPVTTSQHDKIIVSGAAVTVTAGGKIVVSNNGYNPTHGDVFNLLDWVGAGLSLNVGGTALNGGLFRTGAESGLDLDLYELGGGYRWDVSLFNSAGIVVVVVPEPSRALLILLGLLGLMMRRRRKVA